jgi:hypothetical protein
MFGVDPGRGTAPPFEIGDDGYRKGGLAARWRSENLHNSAPGQAAAQSLVENGETGRQRIEDAQGHGGQLALNRTPAIVFGSHEKPAAVGNQGQLGPWRFS